MNTKHITLKLAFAALCATSMAPVACVNTVTAKKNKSISTKSMAVKLGLAALGVTSVVLAAKKASTIETDNLKTTILDVYNTTSGVCNDMWNWIKNHKAFTALTTSALLYPHVDNYLVEEGKQKLKNEKLGLKEKTPRTIKEKIVHTFKQIIGYKIKTKGGEAKVKVLQWNNDEDLVLKGELEISKTELKSVKLGKLLDVIETTIEKNKALALVAFYVAVKKGAVDMTNPL